MYRHHSITAVIPCFNEAPRITQVLKPVLNSRYLDEIIVIDDGSTDSSARTVRNFSSRIRLLRNSHNQGKSRAIFRGIRAAASPTVFLIDADLRGLQTYHLDTAIAAFFRKKLDMLVLPVKSEYFDAYTQATGWNILATGERIIRKRLLRSQFNPPPEGYALEMFLNRLAKRQHWLTDVITWKHRRSAPVSPSKIKKLGLINGFKGDFKMMREIFRQTNILEYLSLLYLFVISNSHQH